MLIFLLLIPLSLIYFFVKITRPLPGFFLGGSCWLLFLDQITNTYDSLLRFTCLPIYHLGFALSLLLATVWWRVINEDFKGRKSYFILACLTFLAVGTNEITMVHLLVLISSISFFCYRKHGRISAGVVFVLLVTLVGCFLALAAPGNYARMELYPAGKSFLRAGGLSAGVSVFLIIEWLTNSMLMPVGICLLVIHHFLFKDQYFTIFTKPWLWLASVGLIPLSLFPLMYGTAGTSLPERVVDLLFLIFCISVIGWLFALYQSHLSKGKGGIPTGLGVALGLALAIFVGLNFFLGGLSLDRNLEKRAGTYLELVKVEANIGRAYLQLLQGIPQKYASEMQGIQQQLLTCQTDTCEVKPLSVTAFVGYDPLYDRMWNKGESGMNYYWSLRPGTRAVYKKE
ncbi:DUF6056 family protein [Lewinella sp. LCG006]|uniref:DUF6056 family protein n=1 Tax=Lewinella sp. LCG006 TaxID=3231911 RepID=UPI00345FDA87